MTAGTRFRNARIVLADSVVEGSVTLDDGVIAAVDAGPAQSGEDFDGDYLIPGLVELHTDHLESHYRPRPGVFWDAMASLHAHDVQIIGSGITTVFDAVRIGSIWASMSKSSPAPSRPAAAMAGCGQSISCICAANFPRMTSSPSSRPMPAMSIPASPR